MSVNHHRKLEPLALEQTTRSRNGRWMWRWMALLLIGAIAVSWGKSVPALAFDNPTAEEKTATEGESAADSDEHDQDHGGGHSDPVAPLLLGICIILFLAKVGGDAAERVKMPAVLGELLVGVLLGNFFFLTDTFTGNGIDALEFLKPPLGDQEVFSLLPLPDGIGMKATVSELLHKRLEPGATLDMLARVGVILLLFEVGLETSVRQMVSVGKSSLAVAVLGVIVPFILGYGAARLIIPQETANVHMFIGATLCATSVGITARVLKDLGKHQQQEGQIILGAAVIDDVLGLVILAVVTGIIQNGSIDPLSLLTTIGLTLAFLMGAIFLGTVLITRPMFKLASYLRGHGLLVASALTICFGFSWLANQVGLAPIIGAFAAGLILERAHYQELGQKEHFELEEALQPLTALLVPIFFVQMGLQVDLKSFADPSTLSLAAGITVMAIIGKQVCAFGVFEKGLNKTAVGLGMIPRGEVGLIFAAIGKGLRDPATHDYVISEATYSAIVVMVMITTMITPPALKWQLTRKQGEESHSEKPGD